MTALPADRPVRERAPLPQWKTLAATLAASAALFVFLAIQFSPRQALLYLTGMAFGVVLYHAAFGFTSAFRVLIADGRSAGVRAQMVMLAIACALFFPVLANGHLFGQPVSGFVAPAGTSVAVGAFIFGIGMQLGGACASGTLFTVGGGNTRMVLTLLFFILGSVIGLEHLAWWQAMPSLPAVSAVEKLGWPAALALNLALFLTIYVLVSRIELGRFGVLRPIITTGANASPVRQFARGPWPLIAGAAGLALLNFLTLYLAGRPWGITSAFALWGAKMLNFAGVPMASWSSWSSEGAKAALQASVFKDVTSVMNFGIVLGALAAAAAASRFRPGWRVPVRHVAASVIGGLMLGYGARLAYGCNIGAFFSGIASGSLHGWMWIVFALAGNWIGTALRPLFAMEVERTQTAC